MAKNLILFSGGMDSTYLAYKYLVDTHDEITLVVLCKPQQSNQFPTTPEERKINLTKSKIGQFGLDPFQIQDVIKKLKTYRDFNVIYHSIDVSKITNFQLENWYKYSKKVFADNLNNGTYDTVMSGSTWEQHDGQYFKSGLITGLTSTYDLLNNPTKGLTQGRFCAPLLTHDIHSNFNRWHIFNHMPQELIDIIELARIPVGAPENGFNIKSTWDKITKAAIRKGWTASDLDDWRRTKSREYGGGSRDALYTTWSSIEFLGLYHVRSNGVATDGSNIKYDNNIIRTKAGHIDWMTTIEYNYNVDYKLVDKGLGKDDFNLDI